MNLANNNIRINSKLIMLLLFTLTSCASYKSSFNCGDSKGAYCAPMDAVDQMINSGEIERFNEQRQKRQKYKPVEGDIAKFEAAGKIKGKNDSITNSASLGKREKPAAGSMLDQNHEVINADI